MSEAAALSPELKTQLDKVVRDNDVVLFMKGTPQQPQCGFSAQLVQILAHLGVAFVGVNVLEDDVLRQGIKEYSDWPTVPQLYVKAELVGGCDIVRDMFEQNELKDFLEGKAIPVGQTPS